MSSLGVIGAIGALALAGAGFYGADRLLDRMNEAGYQRGLADGRAACHETDLARLREVVAGIETQTAGAQKASRELERAVAARREADRKSTGELRDVLAKTAPLRAACVLPDDVMRQLAEARAAAARAAATGISGRADDRVRAAGGDGK